MSISTKLKPVKWGQIFALIVVLSIICISLFAAIEALLGEESQLSAKGITWLAFALANLTIWIIRKDLLSLSLILLNITMAVSYLIDYKGPIITVPLILILGFYVYLLYANHKFNANYRQILELAARPVHGTTDGFSTRPYPIGSTEIDRDALVKFSKYAKRQFIATPYEEANGIKLALTDHSKFWFGRPNESRDSYVLFNQNGNMVVNISKKDYKKYNQEYSFDELCASLGHLFAGFIHMHSRGEEDKIIEQLSSRV